MSDISKTYILLLLDVMKKKDDILGTVLLATMKQHGCFQNGQFKEEAYDALYQEKMAKLKEIEELDEGFTNLYERLKEELHSNKQAYEAEIKAIQECIRNVTDKSIRLKQLEAENKLLFDGFLAGEKKKIKDYKVNKKTAAVYYKNMMKQFDQEGIFYNRTK